MALAGAIRYHLNPDVPLNLSAVAIIAMGGVLGAIIGSHLVFGIPNIILKRMFACFIIIVGINILVKSFSKSSVSASLQNPENSTAKTPIIPSE